jgi:predicted molibdopterin-dependent oxidoreductase YjgC
MNSIPLGMPRRLVEAIIDGETVKVAEGTTIFEACRDSGTEIPVLCRGETITPKNACRVCMVEVEGSRTLVPSCSRPVEPGMVVHTRNARVDASRRMVLELLGSSVDLSITRNVDRWNAEYGVDTARHCSPGFAGQSDRHGDESRAHLPSRDAPNFRHRDDRHTGSHVVTSGSLAETVEQAVKDDNDLYVRDYSKCIMCYQCVDACGEQWQNTFAIGVAGRGFDIRISTEFNVDLTDSACVYCGNCVQVCPTGALMFRSEHSMRADGTWREHDQTQTDTICPYCGVGCALTLHVQDERIVKVTSPEDHSVTHGNLCIKGRFGFDFVQRH